jgi:hypothetical protein
VSSSPALADAAKAVPASSAAVNRIESFFM